MCIRVLIHRMFCDARPLIAVPRQAKDGRAIVRKAIDPYESPCPCRHEHLKEKTWAECPYNGCCSLETVDLPCRCHNPKDTYLASPPKSAGFFTMKDKANHGKRHSSPIELRRFSRPASIIHNKSYQHGDNHNHNDINRCLHFREYHVYRQNPAFLKKMKEHARFDTKIQPDGKWTDRNHYEYLDPWVLDLAKQGPKKKEDPHHPELCESWDWAGKREKYCRQGARLLHEFDRSEALERLQQLSPDLFVTNLLGSHRFSFDTMLERENHLVGAGQGRRKRFSVQNPAMAIEWNAVYEMQQNLWEKDEVRANALVGFSIPHN